MLSSLSPAVEMTGGPWFTDNELDTEFVNTLKKCARRYLLDNVRFSPTFPPSPCFSFCFPNVERELTAVHSPSPTPKSAASTA